MTPTETTKGSGGNVTLFLHLGLHKTATTFLQHVLRENPEWLADRGVLFPMTGRVHKEHTSSPDGWSGHSALLPATRAHNGNAHGVAQLATLRREIAESGAQTAIVSSEVLFAPRNGPPTTRTFAALDMTVVPVIYLRRQDTFAESLYLERTSWARSDEDRALRGFLREDGASWLDYERRLRPVLRRFEGGEIIIRSYEDAVAGPGILADFCSVIGLEDTPPEGPRQANTSLNPAVVNMMRALNRRDDLTPDRKADISSVLKSDPRWRPTEDERGTSLLSDADWDGLREKYAAMNDRLADTVMSGPTDRFRWPDSRPPARPVQHRFTVAKAKAMSLKLWPEDPQIIPAPVQTRRTAGQGPGIGIVSLQRQPPQQTRDFVTYHLRLGIDRIALFLDDPEDPIGPEMAALDRVEVHYCSDEFWQGLIAGRPASQEERQHLVFQKTHECMTADGLEWLICLDGDELLYGDLDAVLADAAVPVINIPPAEAIGDTARIRSSGFGPGWFKRLPHDTRGARDRAQTLHADTQDLTRLGFFGHTQGKAFLHRDAQADIFNQHNPRNSSIDLLRRTADAAVVLHFDGGRFETWLDRARGRASGTLHAAGMSPRRQEQIDRTAAAFESGGIEAARALYDSWYGADADRLAELEAAGLAFHADLPDDAFGD